MNETATPVIIPLLNPNEFDARLVSLAVRDGGAVRTGDLLCTIETTKASADLLAESDGFIVGLHATTGQLMRAGDILCYISSVKEWVPEVEGSGQAGQSKERAVQDQPDGLRITQPAVNLAGELGIELASLPVGPLVTVETIRQLQLSGDISIQRLSSEPAQPVDPKAIIVYGGGGHGKSVIDLIRTIGGFQIHGIIDDGIDPGEQLLGIPVLGGVQSLIGLYNEGIRQAVNAVGGIGDIKSRLTVFRRLADAGFTCPAVVHPSAVIEGSALLSNGVQVFPQAYVGSESRIGYGVIINTGAVVSHDCLIEDYANLSPGALLAGGVKIGERVLIGMGATINLGVEIGPGSRVGNGATVKTDVPPDGIVRAGSIWPG